MWNGKSNVIVVSNRADWCLLKLVQRESRRKPNKILSRSKAGHREAAEYLWAIDGEWCISRDHSMSNWGVFSDALERCDEA